MIFVSISKTTDKKSGLERPVRYSDIPMDKEHWITDLTYRPIPFDLLYLKIKDLLKVKAGWWNGEAWQGLRLKQEDEVIAWKRQLYDYALG